MSTHSNRLIVARTSSKPGRLVPYSADYGKFGAKPTEFTNMKDARKVMTDMVNKEHRGRTWMILRIEAEVAPVEIPATVKSDVAAMQDAISDVVGEATYAEGDDLEEGHLGE